MDDVEREAAELADAPATEVARRLRDASTSARPLFALLGRSGALEVLYHVAVHEPVRFSELKAALAISSSTLSTRLSEFEAAGFVERTFYDENPPRAEYSGTTKLTDLKPVFYRLLAWAERYGYEAAASGPDTSEAEDDESDEP